MQAKANKGAWYSVVGVLAAALVAPLWIGSPAAGDGGRGRDGAYATLSTPTAEGAATDPAGSGRLDRSLDGLADLSDQAVADDLRHRPASAHARFVRQVTGADRGSPSPAGVTAKSLIVFGLAVCADPAASAPATWGQAPGLSPGGVDAFVRDVRTAAPALLCR